MATIVSYNQPLPLVGVAAGASLNEPPPLVGGAAGAPTNAAQDPLFEALVRYITSGPGPSSTTESEIQSIISSHVNDQGGRAYLESIVQPPQSLPIKLWKSHTTASGTISTGMKSLDLDFKLAPQPMSLQRSWFAGKSPGFYMLQSFSFTDADFRWDDLSEAKPVKTEITYLPSLSMITVWFYNQANTAIAELIITNVSLYLPEKLITGEGQFTTVF